MLESKGMRQVRCPACDGTRYDGYKMVRDPRTGSSKTELKPCGLCGGSGQLNQDQYELQMAMRARNSSFLSV